MAPGIGDYKLGMPANASMAAGKNSAAPNKKIESMQPNVMDMASGDSTLRTVFGAKVDNTDSWMKAGARGPLTLLDPHGREKVGERPLSQGFPGIRTDRLSHT